MCESGGATINHCGQQGQVHQDTSRSIPSDTPCPTGGEPAEIDRPALGSRAFFVGLTATPMQEGAACGGTRDGVPTSQVAVEPAGPGTGSVSAAHTGGNGDGACPEIAARR